jgi:GLPGLI family protein
MMKRLLFSLSLLFTCIVAFAQQKEGTVVFERKVNLYKMIPNEQMRSMMPEFRTTKHILLFSDSISVFKLVPEDEAPDPFDGQGGGGGIMRMISRFGGVDGGDLYKNFGQTKAIQTQELGGKTFLIVDTIKPQPWKLSMETKQILGYNCHKATRKMPAPMRVMSAFGRGGGAPPPSDTTKPAAPKEIEVVAWFADVLISPVGPENFGQLPGAILELNVDNGATVFTAKEVKKTVEAKELKEPKKGKVVTQAEYAKLMQQMMSNFGGQGGQRMEFRSHD